MVWSCKRRSTDAALRKIYSLEITGISRWKGRPKKTWIEKVRNNLKALNCTDKIAQYRTELKHMIHLTDPNYWDWSLMMMMIYSYTFHQHQLPILATQTQYFAIIRWLINIPQASPATWIILHQTFKNESVFLFFTFC